MPPPVSFPLLRRPERQYPRKARNVQRKNRRASHSLPGSSSGSSSYNCSCGKTANRADKSKHASHTHSSAHHQHQHHHHQHGHQCHSTISSSIRKELASYENPYQAQAAVAAGARKKPTKRNASTESLDLFDKCPPEECSCGLYSPSSINGGKSCRKCRSSVCDSPSSPGRSGTLTGGGGAQQKKHNSSKFKDASTSPKSSSPMKTIAAECRSPKIEASTDTKFDFNFSPKTENHYRRLSSLSINSAGGKHAGTSPMKHAAGATASSAAASPKPSPQKLTPMRTSEQRTLEKSNSLGENKPPRLLRNTRSLSPRPPVRHQHSIMVSDENDIISVKLSPNEEYDDEVGKKGSAKLDEGSAHEGRPDPATVKGSGEKVKKLGDGLKSANGNRSTSCLVYVPSDPWTRMSASNSPLPSSKQQKSKTLDNNSKAYGKPCLDYMKNSDPWVWRSNVNLPDRSAKGGPGKKRSAALPHQTKSLTSTVSRDDSDVVGRQQAKLCQQQSLGRFEKTLTIPGAMDGSFDARKKITRPKLQRSKSPSFYEDFFQQPTGAGGGGGGLDAQNKSPQTGSLSLAKNKSVSSLKMEKNASNSNLNGHSGTTSSSVLISNSSNTSNSGSFSSYNGNGSPTGRKQQPSPKLSILPVATQSSYASSPAKQPALHDSTKGSLNLLNPNMLQPRHSFSTPSQKDDELQLNIRRLSEQMNAKYSHSAAFPSPPAFLNDTIQQQHQHQHQQVTAGSKKAVGGSGSSLTAVGGTSGGSIGGLNEASQRKTASHSKINEPILETRC
ncbi:adenomatous polyposis coli protein-like [Anopheles stephensi]|uniref:adenomatous polyposis coli protein-like n=1 Tax=Anopheles stephensi TaxID=30069 RepID=UPI0016587376|nr:adenomatous polyposis coli protein-like [Anopheles stephensi]